MLDIVRPKSVLLLGTVFAKLGGVASALVCREGHRELEMSLFGIPAVFTPDPSHVLRLGSPASVVDQVVEDIRQAWRLGRA